MLKDREVQCRGLGEIERKLRREIMLELLHHLGERAMSRLVQAQRAAVK